MNASEILSALEARRWPDDQYVKIREAPEDSARLGRKIDLLAISLWKSRGYEVDAVEVKCSLRDWRREQENGWKADFWWTHSNRFWVATPVELAVKIKPEIPEGWGLLGVADDGRVGAAVPAPRRVARPIPWPTVIGVLRAAANAGVNALQRAEARGREQGRAERPAVSGSDGFHERQLAELRAKVAAFEVASGIPLSETWGDQGARRLGTAVKLVQRLLVDPVGAVTKLERQRSSIGEVATQIDETIAELRRLVRELG